MKNLFPIKYRILSHILFWVCIFGLFIFTSFIKGSSVRDAAILNLALLPFDMAGAYFTIYFLIPKFLFTKKYWQFFLSFILFTVVYGMLIITPAEYYIITTYHHADKWGSATVFVPNRLLWTLVILLMVNGLAASIKITKHWLVSLQHQQNLEQDKIHAELKLREAELKYLRSQIHPHFLFNTLNNLYGLSMEKSDLAPEVVLKLSEMLDFMLYEGKKSLIPIRKELKLLENYIGLEKIRHDANLQLEWKKPARLKRLEIAPFILLAFIENAFKHGGNGNGDEKHIHIELRFKGTTLIYTVSNTIDNVAFKPGEDITEGIGLQNLRKRLGLQYPGCHDISFHQDEKHFHAKMVLDLNPEKTQHEN